MFLFLYNSGILWYNIRSGESMKKTLLFIKKYKYLIIADVVLILIMILFPMKELTSKNTSGVHRTGFILEPDVVVSQEFTSKLDNIERISLMLATINKSIDCNINTSLYDESNNKIAEKVFNNRNIKNVQKDEKNSADYANIYLKNKLTNTLDKNFTIKISTDCNDIVRLQYYEADIEDKKAMYGDMETQKKLPVRYSGSRVSNHNILYSIVIIILSLVIILGGKNEKK